MPSRGQTGLEQQGGDTCHDYLPVEYKDAFFAFTDFVRATGETRLSNHDAIIKLKKVLTGDLPIPSDIEDLLKSTDKFKPRPSARMIR